MQDEDNLRRSNKKVKMVDGGGGSEEVTVQGKDNEMKKNDSPKLPHSYKEILMDVLRSENSEDECWGDFLDDDMLENKWYKD